MPYIGFVLCSFVAGIIVGGIFAHIIENRAYVNQKNETFKFFSMVILLADWIKLKNNNKEISGYLERKGYLRIAVYGMSFIGEILCNDLKDSCICVKYGIDRNAASICSDIEVISPEDCFPDVDAIVVTSLVSFDSIRKIIIEKKDIPVLSIKEIIDAI